MKIAPAAAINDGELNLCLVRELSHLEVIRLLPKVFSGQHIKNSRVSVHSFRKMEVTTMEPITIWADGEPVARTPAMFQAVLDALRVIAP